MFRKSGFIQPIPRKKSRKKDPTALRNGAAALYGQSNSHYDGVVFPVCEETPNETPHSDR
jgi:hypothetical protein